MIHKDDLDNLMKEHSSVFPADWDADDIMNFCCRYVHSNIDDVRSSLGHIKIREDLRDEETFIPVVLADEDKEYWILTDDFFVECPDLEIPEKWQKEGCNLVIKKSSNDVPVKHVNIRNELQTLSNQSRIYYARTADFDW